MPLALLAAHRKELHRLIPLSIRQTSTYVWLHGVLATADLEVAAECLACLMIDYCCVSSGLKESWQMRREGKAYTNSSDAKQLDSFLGPIFGTKAKPISMNHTQGAVAEFLWYLLLDQQDNITDQRIRLEGPGFSPTSSGGDGLGVYKDGNGAYFFKLWEIKKHTAVTSPKGKVGKAVAQLDARAEAYLAQYAQVLSHQEKDGDLALFYQELPKYWIEKTSEAGAGVSVSSSRDFPAGSFKALADKFDWIMDSNKRTGVGIYIDQFADLVKRVREKVFEGME